MSKHGGGSPAAPTVPPAIAPIGTDEDEEEAGAATGMEGAATLVSAGAGANAGADSTAASARMVSRQIEKCHQLFASQLS